MSAHDRDIDARERDFLLGLLAGAELGAVIGQEPPHSGVASRPRPTRGEAEEAVRILRTWVSGAGLRGMTRAAALRSAAGSQASVVPTEEPEPPPGVPLAALFDEAAVLVSDLAVTTEAMSAELAASNREAEATHRRIASQLDRNDRLIAALNR